MLSPVWFIAFERSIHRCGALISECIECLFKLSFIKNTLVMNSSILKKSCYLKKPQHCWKWRGQTGHQGIQAVKPDYVTWQLTTTCRACACSLLKPNRYWRKKESQTGSRLNDIHMHWFPCRLLAESLVFIYPDNKIYSTCTVQINQIQQLCHKSLYVLKVTSTKFFKLYV